MTCVTGDVSLRSLLPSDLDQVKILHDESFPIRYNSDFFESIVHNKLHYSLAAVDRNGKILGVITSQMHLPTDVEESGLSYWSCFDEQFYVYINTLAVWPKYLHLGLGTTLINATLKRFENDPKCKAVYLHVISYNKAAIKFYESNNFRLFTRITDYYFINNKHYDSFVYIYYLPYAHDPSCMYPCFLPVIFSFLFP